MHYHFKVHKERDGYWAQCVEIEGCITEASTKRALVDNMAEALNLILDEPPHSKHIFPFPRKTVRGQNIIKVQVEPKVAMAMLVRTSRLLSKLTQQQVADKMGVKLFAFQRLESAKSANPTWTTINKLIKALPDFPIELLAA